MKMDALINSKSNELNAAANRVKDTSSIRKVLERVLQEMMQLDSGMVNGQVVTQTVLSYGRESFTVIAEGLFEKLATSNAKFAFDWLGQLPIFLQPKGIDYQAWRDRLGVPADPEAYWQKKRNKLDEEIDQLLAAVGDEGGDLSLDKVEQCFNVTLPAALKDAWLAALGGGDNVLNFLVPGKGLRDLLETARFVTEEQSQYEVVDERVEGKPFSLLPIADGLGDSDYVALNLSKPIPTENDFGVLYCLHDVGEPGAQFVSSVEWMERERPIMGLLAALNDAAEEDEETLDRVNEWVDRGEELEFDQWCRETMRTKAPAFYENKDAVSEAMERFWESLRISSKSITDSG